MDDSVRDSGPRQKDSGAKRLTGEAAFIQAKEEIAERNETTQKAGRKVRDASEQRKAQERRERDLL
jgi:hypothetical protein